jgi:hypothetical protein
MPTPLEKRLLAIVRELSEADAGSVVAFAEFLQQRSDAAPREIPLLQLIERPAQESVVKAVKRLAATYPMVDRAKMLNETSVLVSQHVMQGRDAVEVIDELEILFRRHYEKLKSNT